MTLDNGDNSDAAPPTESVDEVPEGSDSVLRQLAQVAEGWGAAPLPSAEGEPAPEPLEALFRAYREGSLEDQRQRDFEERLSHDPGLRRRFATSAGVELPGPSPKIRQRALAAYRQTEPAAAPGRRLPLIWIAAAAVAATVAAALLLPVLQAPTLPAELSYEVQAQGLGQERSGEPPERDAMDLTIPPQVLARPETQVRFTIAPRQLAEANVAFGLYRLDPAPNSRPSGKTAGTPDGSSGAPVSTAPGPPTGASTGKPIGDGVLVRLVDGVHVEVQRGAAVLTATGALLAGLTPPEEPPGADAHAAPSLPTPLFHGATIPLFTVVARPGDLPPRLDLDALPPTGAPRQLAGPDLARARDALEDGSRRRAYPFLLELQTLPRGP